MIETSEGPECPVCCSKDVTKLTDDPSPDETIVMNYQCNKCKEYFEWR